MKAVRKGAPNRGLRNARVTMLLRQQRRGRGTRTTSMTIEESAKIYHFARLSLSRRRGSAAFQVSRTVFTRLVSNLPWGDQTHRRPERRQPTPALNNRSSVSHTQISNRCSKETFLYS
ncbi:unnamed protein product, partial [Hapterophycus canaliculatus]